MVHAPEAMARRERETRAELSVPAGRSRARARRTAERGAAIRDRVSAVRDEPSFNEWAQAATRWRKYAVAAPQNISTGNALEEEFTAATHVGIAFIGGAPPTLGEKLTDRLRDLDAELNVLEAVRERLPLLPAPTPTPSTPGQGRRGSDVFIVHGRRRDSADVVARFVEKLDLNAIILDEQANEGRTVLEKLEHNASSVAFAVVLLQPDDWARGADDDDWPSQPNRARQNVILELGFFVGLIGRRRVAALVAPGVEQPSDIHGLAYVPFDDSWQVRLAKELKSAMPKLDLNRALS